MNFRHAAHITMIAFAAASLGNVRAFLVTAGHPVEVAWALGLALGTSLVVVSIMLSHLDRHADRDAWRWLLATGLVLGVVSGAVQSAEYARHLALPWAVLLGFSIPLGGEVLLALAVSSYSRARERVRFRSVSDLVEGAVVNRLEEAIANLDPEAIHKHVARVVTGLARQAVTNVAAQAATYYAVQNDLVHTVDDGVSESPKVDDRAESLQRANVERQKLAEQRRHDVLGIVRTTGSAAVSEIAAALDNPVSRTTLTEDLHRLAEQKLVYNANKRWHAMPHTNGVHA